MCVFVCMRARVLFYNYVYCIVLYNSVMMLQCDGKVPGVVAPLLLLLLSYFNMY